MAKNLLAMQETWARFLGWEDPLEEGMATHSSILAWRIPMDRGAWGATVHGVAKSQTKLNDSAQRSYLVLLISTILFLLYGISLWSLPTNTYGVLVICRALYLAPGRE